MSRHSKGVEMSSKSALSAVVMGEESLLMQGAEAWLARGHEIRAVVTDVREIKIWAEKHGLRVVTSDDALDGVEVDYFVSFAGSRKLPSASFARAARGVIHVHDGLLPECACAHATTWAIMEGAARHGITWLRVYDDGSGEVLLERTFDLSPDESALSLNTRCHAAAVESFDELMATMESGSLPVMRRERAPMHDRATERRPWALGHLDFRRPARELSALVRALDFGAYRNPLAVPKFTSGGLVLRVAKCDPIDAPPGREPGFVLAVGQGFIDVATGEGGLRLSRVSTLDGRELPDAWWPRVGSVLEWPDAARANELERVGQTLAAHEPVFSRRLSEAMPSALRAISSAERDPEWHALELRVELQASPMEWSAAFVSLLARLSGASRLTIAYADEATLSFSHRAPQYVAPRVPLNVDIAPDTSFGDVLRALERDVAVLARAGGYARDLPVRETRIAVPECAVGVTIGATSENARDGLALHLAVSSRGPRLELDASRVDPRFAQDLARRLSAWLESARESRDLRVVEHPLVSADERARLVERAKGPIVEVSPGTIVDGFEGFVDRQPGATALIVERDELSYRDLDELANGVAQTLSALSLPRNSIIGLSVARGPALVYGALGIMKAGHAYLPLDPSYPEARLKSMLDDSGAPVVLVDASAEKLFEGSPAKCMRTDCVVPSAHRPAVDRREEDLAYVIYTSGSTGRPKGVMVEHRNVLNFFAGMDERVEHVASRRVWLAVTSLSFDISVLELFYTLSRGFTVVIASDEDRSLWSLEPSGRPIDFGLYYWGNDGGRGREKYRLLLEGARIADASGFNSVWTPERHFHAFGGPYPNPAVTGAAIAAITKNVDVRAGSCVLPLHHPARIAEEWAVVDNLTQGRVGVAFASGWQPDDFVLRPENAPPKNRAALLEGMDVVRRLWRGEAVCFPKGDGTEQETVTMPRPMQAELPVWLTTAGNPRTWIDAANAGANVLTHLLGQSIAEVAEKVQIYREALAAAGRDPRAYRVTLMLHTFVGSSREEARRTVELPLKEYLKSAAGLIKNYAWAFPAFKRPEGVTEASSLDLSSLDADELEGILDFAFNRYFEDSGLFGTEEDCLARVEQVRAIGVDEIACLVDFGVDTDTSLSGIERLASVVRRVKSAEQKLDRERGIAPAIRRHGVTHLQCTPSMARMLIEHGETRAALASVKHLFIGGEALQGSLVRALREAAPSASIENMYGPTETTIWSSTTPANETDEIVPIGRPIANTQLYVVDEQGELLPPFVAGELWIGGHGVTRGYLGRPELTEERFVPDTFSGHGRLYRTGDLVRAREDGTLEFLGRVDHQVKIRGHRIELGEVEARVSEVPGVREAVLVAREDRPGDVRLVAYFTGERAGLEDAIRAHLERSLPAYMVPGHLVALERFPLTPNAKVDRKALPRPEDVTRAAVEHVEPTNRIEQSIVDVYREIFGLATVSLRDNFFALGGHSLLAVQAHRKLTERLSVPIGVTDIFRFPVVEALARHLAGDHDAGGALAATKERADQRRRAMLKRREVTRG
jgi:natural product biosynthesis luciferase-like monooxygenase protein